MITIGADPELFVFDEKTSQFKSAHNLFPGTKALPEAVDGGAIQVDGVAFEFNIEPSENFTQFSNNIRKVLNVGRDLLSRSESTFKLIPTATATFDTKYFDSLPEYAKELGCDPDFNAYTGKENPRPATTEPFRTGSGHIHVGWGSCFDKEDPDHIRTCERMTVQLDVALYFASLLWDRDRRRRSLYGKIGAYRPKSYGVEYRVLSNRWVSEILLQDFVFGATKHAAGLLLENDVFLPEDKDIKKYLDMALRGHDFSTEALFDFVDNLSLAYGFPSVPVEKSDIAQNLIPMIH